MTKQIFDLSYPDTIFPETPVQTQTTFFIWIQVTLLFHFGKWILRHEAILWSIKMDEHLRNLAQWLQDFWEKEN